MPNENDTGVGTLDPDTPAEPSPLERMYVRFDGAVDQLREITTAAATGERAYTEEESERRTKLTDTIDNLTELIADMEADEERKAKAARSRVQNGNGTTPQTNGTDHIRVGNEPHMYEPGGEHSYFWDLAAMSVGQGFSGHTMAVERLKRHAKEIAVDATAAEGHMRESRTWGQQYQIRQVLEVLNPRDNSPGVQNRNLSTAAGLGGEFVPPLFLTEQYVPFARAGRVFADQVSKYPLPAGTMSVNIPKVTGGTAVGTQGQQNTPVTQTDLTTAFVTFPVVTKAGQQTVSLQILERSPIAFDDVIFKDLALALAQAIDIACLIGPGTVGANVDSTGTFQTAGINTITWTQVAPTVPLLYSQVAKAKASIASTRFMPATHLFMTPTRWESVEGAVDSNGRPFVVPTPQGPTNSYMAGPDQAVAEGLVGRMLGLPLFIDYNIPVDVLADALNPASGNQDLVFVTKADDDYLYEAPMTARALPQTLGQNLSVLVQLYQYMAYTAARYPVANAVITGTGLLYPPPFPG